jgi:hypothetical protein
MTSLKERVIAAGRFDADSPELKAFFEKCAAEAMERFKGNFVRLDQQAFVLGCAHGYGAMFGS